MLISDKLDFLIKYVAIFILFSYIIFFDFFFIKIEKKELIEIDNEMKANLFENETTFIISKLKIKPIAFYYPEYNNISYIKFFKMNETIKIVESSNITRLIKAQIQLAKNHGIYGFAIFFNLFKIIDYSQETINVFLNNISFPFFFVWRNEEIENIDSDIIKILFDNITKFLMSDNYITMNKKPILSINSPFKFLNINNILSLIRKEAKIKIGEIFIFYPFVGNFKEKKFLREFDAIYDFSNLDLLDNITKNNPNILYYSGIIYKNIILNDLNIDFPLFRTCYINNRKFKDYKPEKFYIANNIILKWENSHIEENQGFFFIESWNDYQNDNYMEPDEKYGFATINSFSKSILNLPYRTNKSIIYRNAVFIAIHIHVYYEELIEEIINKVNSIPIKYDLFISTVSEEKKSFIKKCLSNSNANSYEIKIFENKGRDVLPFIKQMKSEFKKYKYICHIHTKKSTHKESLGKGWREYIYHNLIGNRDIISEILYDFEKYEKLGFIFPEVYYDIIKGIYNFENTNFGLHIINKKYMNFILQKIFGKFKIDEKLVFPVGNMFWAKTKAIYQIFHLNFKFPKELEQNNETIMHAIERIWLYLVKLNGYFYKTIFNHY